MSNAARSGGRRGPPGTPGVEVAIRAFAAADSGLPRGAGARCRGYALAVMDAAWRERITADPGVVMGKPVVRGKRIAVEFVLDLVASGWSFDQVLANYPGLTVEDIRACFGGARDVVAEFRATNASPR